MPGVRKSQRVSYRHTVKFGPSNPPENTAFTINLSKGGVCIKTTKVYAHNTRLFLSLGTKDRFCDAEGVVRWAKKVHPALIRSVHAGMGIMFTSVENDFWKINPLP